ncbi:transcription elongation factor GreA [Burkholderia ubonensis]|nr:transcription elongation factor GreA [Burkholderia ubonensis]KWI89679.1 transcription elongation factor GreA [Burkholderia ubonensis]KWI99333.1 transcription elongation factor GreA [Burkholderia ubonensis]KWK03371.1 transcription elongation factor GreA [Burkholderia ubonensis]KWK44345.1 transcription elongation factor GreA [Burkholderia ubonensis]
MIEYPNVPRSIGAVISRRLATLHELQTVYGQDDLHDLLEIIIVDSYNERVAMDERRN